MLHLMRLMRVLQRCDLHEIALYKSSLLLLLLLLLLIFTSVAAEKNTANGDNFQILHVHVQTMAGPP